MRWVLWVPVIGPRIRHAALDAAAARMGTQLRQRRGTCAMLSVYLHGGSVTDMLHAYLRSVDVAPSAAPLAAFVERHGATPARRAVRHMLRDIDVLGVRSAEQFVMDVITHAVRPRA